MIAMLTAKLGLPDEKQPENDSPVKKRRPEPKKSLSPLKKWSNENKAQQRESEEQSSPVKKRS